MTDREAMMFYLNNPEGPFPESVWEHIKVMYGPRPDPEDNPFTQRIRRVGTDTFRTRKPSL